MIKVYIVTYKKTEVLNRNLKSLWSSTSNLSSLFVTVLSNHPEIYIEDSNKRDNLRVLLNTTRAPHAWGYLSRDWNYGIIDCYKTWRNPDGIKWCVLAQNDVEWVDGWDEFLLKNHRFDLITQPRGDQCIALNIEAVKKIGFFDERFCTLGFQEIDYFIRAVSKIPDKVSINDDFAFSHNPIGEVITKYAKSAGDEVHHPTKFHKFLFNLFLTKWHLNENQIIYDKQRLFDRVLRLKKANKFPKEVNWYPFFWESFDDNASDFLDDYYKENKLSKFSNLLYKVSPRLHKYLKSVYHKIN